MSDDQYAWRSGGTRIDLGSEGDLGISSLIEVEDKLFCLTQKNIKSIIMADTIDPKRTNPNVRHSQQQILPYGSESPLVGRTFQQASILFKEGILPNTINYKEGVNISYSFLNEIISLSDKKDAFIDEQDKINSSLETKPAPDETFHLPSIPNLDQKIYNFILNADHASAFVMKLVQLFYPNIKNSDWVEELYKKLKEQFGDDNDVVIFVKSFKDLPEKIRCLRNAIEHKHNPENNDEVNSSNYHITPKNVLELPSISFNGKYHPFSSILISEFMESTLQNLLSMFELMMVHLCDIHVEPFAGDKRFVVGVPLEKRQPNENNVGFKYDILWTK